MLWWQVWPSSHLTSGLTLCALFGSHVQMYTLWRQIRPISTYATLKTLIIDRRSRQGYV